MFSRTCVVLCPAGLQVCDLTESCGVQWELLKSHCVYNSVTALVSGNLNIENVMCIPVNYISNYDE